MAFCAGQADAKLHYDLYYGLPGGTGSKILDAGLFTGDIGSIGDISDVPVMAKYALSDKLEVGARITLGVLNDDNDSFHSLLVGAKHGLSDNSAVTVNVLTPVAGVDDIGLSVGYMMSKEMGGMTVNKHLQAAFLDGYTGGTGVGLDLLVEPAKPLGNNLVGYLDILVSTNMDDITGDPLGINLGPNVDFTLNENTVINAGIVIGIAGDAKADEIGLGVAALIGM